MSENRATKKGRNWLIIGIAAGVVMLLLAALMVIDYATKSGRNEATEPPTTTAPTGQQMAGLTVGSGGTKTGTDGVTKIGYDGTCDSAVQAATNYFKAATDVFFVSDKKKVAFINEVVLPGPTKDALLDDAKRRTEVMNSPQGPELAKGYTETTHVEWGGAYKVTDCSAERTAIIQILECSLNTIGEEPKRFTTCGTDTIRLVWSNGDWKVISINEDLPGVVLNVTSNIPGWEPSPETLPMPAAIRDAYLINSVTGAKDEGWVDYVGITRK